MSAASRAREAERNRGRFAADGLTPVHLSRQSFVEEHTRGIVVHPGMRLNRRNLWAETMALVMRMAAVNSLGGRE